MTPSHLKVLLKFIFVPSLVVGRDVSPLPLPYMIMLLVAKMILCSFLATGRRDGTHHI